MQKILLLHGAVGAQDHLQPLADLLSDRYEVLRFLFSGHGGKSFSQEDFSIPFFAEEVRSYLNEQHLSSLPIVGYSMGGYVAMHLARKHPEQVTKIVTLATKFHWDEETAAKEIKMLHADKIEEKLPAFAQTLQNRHAPNDWKRVLTKTQEMLTEMGKENPLQLSDYAAIDIPCLLTLGDRDKMISLAETREVFTALPHARMAVLPGTQHPIEQTNVEALAFLIKQFIG